MRWVAVCIRHRMCSSPWLAPLPVTPSLMRFSVGLSHHCHEFQSTWLPIPQRIGSLTILKPSTPGRGPASGFPVSTQSQGTKGP
jgi:hypothetical protein